MALLAFFWHELEGGSSRGDWPKRTQGQAYSDQNHASAA
jgi:hypothetical protein